MKIISNTQEYVKKKSKKGPKRLALLALKAI